MLHAFARRSLTGADSAAIAEHAATCPKCAGVLSELARAATVSASDLEASGALPPQAQIGRYVILRLLGEGGMGAVYLANDSQLDRKVALKLLHATTSADARARMAREARLMARFVHPNIVTVYDAGESDGQMYIVMEFIAGQTLAAWLASEPRSIDAILAAFRAAGAALAEAHAAGVAHRDFKPENVLLDQNGRIAVSDFGIASEGSGTSSLAPSSADETASLPALPVASNTSSKSLTRTGTMMGTPAYMSPEQFLGRPAGPTSDQFSFGVALYEALFDQPPFPASSLDELRRAVLRGELAPMPEKRRALVPPAIVRALVRALSRDPASRFPDMRALLAALEPPPVRKRPWAMFAVIAAVVLAVAGGAGAFLWHKQDVARRNAEKKKREDETMKRLAREASHLTCKTLSTDLVVHDCIDFAANGLPPHIYFVVDNSLSMADHKGEEKSLVLTLMTQLGIRAEYGLSLLPNPVKGGCEAGGETLAATNLGYTPQRAKEHDTELMRDLGSAPIGHAAAGATLRSLRTIFSKHKERSKIAVVLLTDGGVTCDVSSACDAHSCLRNIESQTFHGQVCKPAGPSCCTDKMEANTVCLDDTGTVAAIKALAADGIHTSVLGIKPLDRYKETLESFAVAGGVRRVGTTGWYDENSVADLVTDLRRTLMPLPTSLACNRELTTTPLDRPDAVTVLFDGELAPQSWKAEKKKITFSGEACARIESGQVGWVRIVSE